ncbi:MAG: gfo/Idh/MocA family oxidoreductase, partial [Deltaproteobacteria bacterium]|nr:gfo/Idh/MocA family oxidoreductase [Deltaproteobacteria bacterium]
QPDAYLHVNCLKRELTVTRLDGQVRDLNQLPVLTSDKIEFPGSDPLADQIASFVNAVINKSQPIVSGQDGRRALKFALAIMDQIERGCGHFHPAR